MEGIMRNAILCCLMLCLTPGDGSRSLASEDDEPAYEGRSLSFWIASLSSEDAKVRAQGAYSLGVMGPEARRGIPALLCALRDDDELVRSSAACCLSSLKAEPALVLPILIGMLQTEDDPYWQYKIAFAIGGYGPIARDAIPSLVHLLHSPKPSEQASAAIALAEIGPEAEIAAPELIKCLAGPDRYRYAARALRRIGSGAVPVLRQALSDENHLIRVRAAALLWEIAKDKVAVNALCVGLRAKDTQIQLEAVLAIREIGPDAEQAIPALVDTFGSPTSEETRSHAEKALARFGRRSLPALLSALGHQDWRIRMHAASTLGLMPDNVECSLPSLVGLLEDPSPLVRRKAARSIGSFESRAALAVPNLRRALRDDEVRGYAAVALGDIGPAAYSAVPDLIESLEDTTNGSRDKAAIALGKIGERAAAAIPALKKALRAEDANIRWSAANALGQIKGAAATTVPALTEALSDEDMFVRYFAAQSLARYGPDAREAVPRLAVLFRNGSDGEREIAADALMAIDSEAAAMAGVNLLRLAKSKVK
jgi:HEAT repeat protein